MTHIFEPPHSDEIADMQAWERSFWLARAYMEASLCLCQSMLDGGFSSQYSSSRVVLHLARHGVELFLKGALGVFSKDGVPATHDLSHLYSKYKTTYPDPIFDIDVPARFLLSANFDLFQDELRAFHATLDQRHRYATDRQGKTFATKEEFDPAEILNELQSLDRQQKIIEWAYIRRISSGKPAHQLP
ncbi:hypothetical protein KDW63_22275 [Burkholderia cenocepacia]|uniref:hypothetical protein n=1 Tax=Burkholderia cenocepacia TaxID=95486 RepID=UPI001BA346F3|nr:hypothetical protein [Burkholderia cenocepacia]MBR8296920.1 hypothetical protein [Burkholderia cenocepacia]